MRADPKLSLRVLSAVVFLPLLVVLAKVGGLWFAGLVVLQVVLGLGEFYRMMAERGMRPSGRLGTAMSLVLCALAYFGTVAQTNLLFTGGLLIIFCAELLRSEGERGIEPMAVTLEQRRDLVDRGAVAGIFIVKEYDPHMDLIVPEFKFRADCLQGCDSYAHPRVERRRRLQPRYSRAG